eukprot:scaffold2822_cov100-Isochrysis_galbana.AAC.4
MALAEASLRGGGKCGMASGETGLRRARHSWRRAWFSGSQSVVVSPPPLFTPPPPMHQCTPEETPFHQENQAPVKKQVSRPATSPPAGAHMAPMRH